MLRKIEPREIMTKREAIAKYPTEYFIMIYNEPIDTSGKTDTQDALGYVIYASNKRRDLSKVDKAEYYDKPAGFLHGGYIDTYPSADRIIFHDED